MFKKYINQIEKDLLISEKQVLEAKSFLMQVHYSKILSYILKAKNNPEIKNKWDYVKTSYHNNIQLSSFVYPYIYLFETVLKTRISNLICHSFGSDWYKDLELLSKVNKESKEYIKSFVESYLNKTKPENQDINDFIENGTTFGFWVSIIDSGYFWDSKDIQLREIFAEGELAKTMLSKKQIANKIKGINDLRNKIAHFNQIYDCLISERKGNLYKFEDIFSHILYLSGLMNFDIQKQVEIYGKTEFFNFKQTV
jgi:hypothetical protein